MNTVLITGANRGIGLEFVRQFIGLPKPPVHIFAACRNPESAKELCNLKEEGKDKTKVHIIELDVANDEHLLKAAKTVGEIAEDSGLNLLINNAGILVDTHFPGTSRDLFLRHLDVNTVSPILTSEAFLPLLEKAAKNVKSKGLSCSRAAIVNISSQWGSTELASGSTRVPAMGYQISKAGLNMAARVLARELKSQNRGILVVSVSPGWVKTDMGSADADVTVTDSVSSMMASIESFQDSHHGGFFNRFGKPIPF